MYSKVIPSWYYLCIVKSYHFGNRHSTSSYHTSRTTDCWYSITSSSNTHARIIIRPQFNFKALKQYIKTDKRLTQQGKPRLIYFSLWIRMYARHILLSVDLRHVIPITSSMQRLNKTCPLAAHAHTRTRTHAAKYIFAATDVKSECSTITLGAYWRKALVCKIRHKISMK